VYDRFTHNYKIIAVIFDSNNKNEVNIHTLGTDYWRKIEDLPYNKIRRLPGTFVSDTINWLMYDHCRATKIIVSLDLEKELYQTLSSPHDMQFNVYTTLGVLRGCLL
jgi:F-box interacting protein